MELSHLNRKNKSAVKMGHPLFGHPQLMQSGIKRRPSVRKDGLVAEDAVEGGAVDAQMVCGVGVENMNRRDGESLRSGRAGIVVRALPG